MKKIISLLVCLIIISLFAIPVMAEERSVYGINLPFTTGVISYEKESQKNNSWIIGGLIGINKGADSDAIDLSLACGGRFYNGANNNRFYKGLYGTLDYSYYYWKDPNLPEDQITTWSNYMGGIAGVFGYELRFGETKNPRIFVECGFKANYSPEPYIGFSLGPVVGAGFGFSAH